MVVYPGTKQQTTSNNLKQIQVLCLCITSFYLFSQPFTTQDCRRLPPFGHHTEGDAPTRAPQIQEGQVVL